MDFYVNRILDEYATKTVRLVEEGYYPADTTKPTNSKEKFDLACQILTDSLSNIGFNTHNFHIPAIIANKVNQLFHDERPKRFNNVHLSRN